MEFYRATILRVSELDHLRFRILRKAAGDPENLEMLLMVEMVLEMQKRL